MVPFVPVHQQIPWCHGQKADWCSQSAILAKRADNREGYKSTSWWHLTPLFIHSSNCSLSQKPPYSHWVCWNNLLTANQQSNSVTGRYWTSPPLLLFLVLQTWQIMKKNTTAKVILVLSFFHDRRTYNKFKCDFQPKLAPTGITNIKKEIQVLSHAASSTNHFILPQCTGMLSRST